jgi:hypothetical protein
MLLPLLLLTKCACPGSEPHPQLLAFCRRHSVPREWWDLAVVRMRRICLRAGLGNLERHIVQNGSDLCSLLLSGIRAWRSWSVGRGGVMEISVLHGILPSHNANRSLGYISTLEALRVATAIRSSTNSRAAPQRQKRDYISLGPALAVSCTTHWVTP